MPSWSGILEELSEGPLDDFRTFDLVRRDYLYKLSETAYFLETANTTCRRSPGAGVSTFKFG